MKIQPAAPGHAQGAVGSVRIRSSRLPQVAQHALLQLSVPRDGLWVRRDQHLLGSWHTETRSSSVAVQVAVTPAGAAAPVVAAATAVMTAAGECLGVWGGPTDAASA
eukprot:363222-Chlamydomonas_euryale.AAC.5